MKWVGQQILEKYALCVSRNCLTRLKVSARVTPTIPRALSGKHFHYVKKCISAWACSYKKKAQSRKAKVKELEEKLENCTKNCENDPSKENVEELEFLQAEYDDLDDYIAQGAIVRSRANWYAKGEKITSISYS